MHIRASGQLYIVHYESKCKCLFVFGAVIKLELVQSQKFNLQT